MRADEREGLMAGVPEGWDVLPGWRKVQTQRPGKHPAGVSKQGWNREQMRCVGGGEGLGTAAATCLRHVAKQKNARSKPQMMLTAKE